MADANGFMGSARAYMGIPEDRGVCSVALGEQGESLYPSEINPQL